MLEILRIPVVAFLISRFMNGRRSRLSMPVDGVRIVHSSRPQAADFRADAADFGADDGQNMVEIQCHRAEENGP